jgi:hypothetical protein
VVEFDDDFNAKVTFPDGTQGEVCLEDYAED